jgi:hypothetical protein
MVSHFLCFVDRASRYICVIKTNLTHYLSSVYFANQPLHVSGIFVAHHQEVCCIYATTGTYCAFQLTVCWTAGQQTVFVRNYIKILQFHLTYWNMQYCMLHLIGDLWYINVFIPRRPTRITNTVYWSVGPTDSQLKSTTRTSCCIYTAHLLMMGYKYARNI